MLCDMVLLTLSGRVLGGEFSEVLASDSHYRRLSLAGDSGITPRHSICEKYSRLD